MSMQGTISAAERSIRSVFVGNIPYEATEEQLKDIFSEVGPVISFRLVYDRESGKPKGYGFCEYKDQETAMSAMRNLNGYELNGRALRVDNAASEKNKEELRNLQASMVGPPVESPYGPECDPDKAPEAISKAVASLPPEQMFELMKQMKSCIQNNPNEARNMLLLNPQLAYALLQAQVVMRIVEPQVAMGMLMRPNTDVQPLRPPPSTSNDNGPPVNPQPLPGPPPVINHPSGPQQTSMGSNYGEPPFGSRPPMGMNDPRADRSGPMEGPRGPNHGMGGQFGDHRPPPGGREFEMRGDPRGGGQGGPGFDPRDQVRMGPNGPGMGMNQSRDPRDLSRDPRNMPHDAEMRQPNFDPRRAGDPRSGGRPPMDFEQRGMGAPPFGTGGFESRSPVYEQQQQQQPQSRDPRSQAIGQGPAPGGRPPLGPPMQGGPSMRPGLPNVPASGPPMGPGGPAVGPRGPLGTQDQEKAALIMQVLQLSEQQIAMLPPEQRQSIMVLKEQIARSTQNQ